ncbi:hypothetical protein J6590_037112 [Homalodisca vitripennis]|nr:hypothetical protein J6590_037112 [Homalodisca vitripennis]
MTLTIDKVWDNCLMYKTAQSQLQKPVAYFKNCIWRADDSALLWMVSYRPFDQSMTECLKAVFWGSSLPYVHQRYTDYSMGYIITVCRRPHVDVSQHVASFTSGHNAAADGQTFSHSSKVSNSD